MSAPVYKPTCITTRAGLELRQIARAGTVAEFTAAFIPAMRLWAKEASIPSPENLEATTHKQRVSYVSGASPLQVERLYARVRQELGLNVVHSSRECDTLGTMAAFYHQQLRRQEP